MSKHPIAKLWLYRYRFYILQIALALGFAGLLVVITLNSIHSISDAEMASAVESSSLGFTNILQGNILDLPFRLLQTLSIRTFGLTVLAIKLPSLIIAAITGIFLILLINRWHKTNVAVITCLLAIPSALFLGSAISGTPAIMAIFFPVIILWLGSKLVGEKQPSPVLAFILAAMFALSCYTPYFVYAAVAIPLLCLLHPHLRLSIKRFGTLKILLLLSTFVLLLSPIIVTAFTNLATIKQLFVPDQLSFSLLLDNFTTATKALSYFTTANPTPVLQPVLGISLTLIAFIGIVAIIPNRHASRYGITGALIFFAAATSLFDSNYIVAFFLPATILIAAGINFILTEWYSLFPLNPYPRIIGGLFVFAFACTIIVSNVTFFLYAPHHVQSVNAAQHYELPALRQNLDSGSDVIVSEESLDFYRLLEKEFSDVHVSTSVPEKATTVIYIDAPESIPPDYTLTKVVTAPTYQNADLLYVYSRNQE